MNSSLLIHPYLARTSCVLRENSTCTYLHPEKLIGLLEINLTKLMGLGGRALSYAEAPVVFISQASSHSLQQLAIFPVSDLLLLVPVVSSSNRL